MYGRIELTGIFIPFVFAVSLIAALSDMLRGRIYNWLTLPCIAVGMVVSLCTLGWAGLGSSLLGVLIGLILYGWMFRIGVMGGGDVKLLMALGAWGGARYVEEVGVLGVLLGGAMALLILAYRGKLMGFARKIQRFFLTLFVKELVLQVPEVDRKLTMPYGVPIAIAAVWSALAHPLQKWGVPLWP